ncbi:MAG: hypothetical protein Kow0029_11830 [Candidatus Rifleibacteriota bacterium]
MNKSGFFIKMSLFAGLIVALAGVASATEIKGTVSVKRNNARQIVGAELNSGSKVYEIVMDENGKSIAQMYEHKEIKLDCTIQGNSLKAITWEEIRMPSSPEPVYNEPEPKEEPAEEEIKDEEEPNDDKVNNDEESGDDETKIDEQKDDDSTDEEPKDQESNDDEPKDEETNEEY